MKKGWKIKRLADVLELQNGYAFDSKGFNPTDGLPLIRIRSLKAGVETETRFSGDYEKKYVVKAGDLLIGMDGEFGCYEWKGEAALLNQRVCRLQGFTGELIPRFLFYGVNDYLKAIEDVTGYTTVKHISSKQILEIEFPVPPLAEQQRIVGLLDEAFEGLATAKANAEKNLQNARALFESDLQSVFTQRGSGWVEKPFEDCIEDVKYTAKIQRKDFLEEGEFPIVSQEAEFTNGYWDNAADVFKVTRPVVIFGDHTQVLKYIDFDFVLGADGVKLLPPKPFLNPKFFFYALRSAPLKSLGYARHFRLLKELLIGYPDMNAQVAIAKNLDSLENETQRLARLYERKHAALEALKKSLLHQAFTGAL